MKNIHPHKELVGLMIYIVIFGMILIASIVSYFSSTQLLDIGLPARTTDLFLALLSLAGLIRAVWHAHLF